MWQASDSGPAMRGANERPARRRGRRDLLSRSLPSERAIVKRHSLPGRLAVWTRTSAPTSLPSADAT